NYNFYTYAENRFDLNIFYKDFQSWIQYEYSNPPDIGFSINDIRKFRIEYGHDNYTVKLGDIYEFWGRGLLLNQIDDQTTNFDNGIRGMFLGYENGLFTFNHINGNSNIWNFGNDLRIPEYKNSHNVSANQILFDLNSVSLGLSHLSSKEKHDLKFDLRDSTFVFHNMKGIYGSWILDNVDLFVEYVDKVSTEKNNLYSDGPLDSLKSGHGVYLNFNIYGGNWGLSTEYKRYAFDKGHSSFTPDDYGNRIAFQAMPTLVREQNATLLGRVAHQFNFNDERGVQVSLTGSILNLDVISQYAHLSRNEEWQSLTLMDWVDTAIDGYLPGSNPSALPYWENYFEISGSQLNDNLYFKLGRGQNRDILEIIRYFKGEQQDRIINSFWEYDTTIVDFYGEEYTIIDSAEYLDTSFTDLYSVETKMWQESKSITYPLELSYLFNNGYSVSINFEYQEKQLRNTSKGNSRSYNASDSLWVLIDPENPDSNFTQYDNLFYVGSKNYDTQFNRMFSLTIGKASKWSATLTHDQTNAFSGPTTVDPYYNPLEALIFGDLKYFTGKRNKVAPPNFIQKRWVSLELAYNLTSSQRISILYGSLQGGLFCSNGVCRTIAPFNDGIKLSYSAIF
ncbi:MAG: hypothetical protein HOK59_03885, partial [Candidatus Marinimicrobia bacterium]|nr:hypothetical protein [Candidatus Neomarinimicrobiota bacterium]